MGQKRIKGYCVIELDLVFWFSRLQGCGFALEFCGEMPAVAELEFRMSLALDSLFQVSGIRLVVGNC